MPDSGLFLKYIEDTVYNKRSGIIPFLLRILLFLLSQLYKFAIWLYKFLLNHSVFKMHRLPKPVISIGNITVGGTGKTPVVQYIARKLADFSFNPAILSYGYKGSLKGNFGMVSDKRNVLLSSAIAGDEPVMLAESLPGIPVLVSKHRHISGMKAINDLKSDVLILDDGFQVWKLFRDFDIILLSVDNPFDNRNVLPAGKLREPLSSLKRAGCIIISGATDKQKVDDIKKELSEIIPGIPVFESQYSISKVIYINEDKIIPVDEISGKNVFAISSIGNPSSFENTIRDAGVHINGFHVYEDHYRYAQSDVDFVCRQALSVSASMIVTTMKDAVKLREFSFSVPIAAIDISLKISDEEYFLSIIKNKLSGIV